MLPEQFNALLVDIPDSGLLPRVEGEPAHKRSAYAVVEVLCSAQARNPVGPFAVGRTPAGAYVGIWPCHADLFVDADELGESLNRAELELLKYKAHL